jgi:hypothetical protein
MVSQLRQFSYGLVALALATGAVVTAPVGSVAIAQTQNQDLNQTVAALLASNPNGGDQLAQAVHDLVLANPAALNIIIAAVKANGNDAQQSAVGQGLGMAAQDAVKANNQQLAVAIQAAVAGSGMPLAVASFTTAAGDATIAAISNAGGGQQAGGGGGAGSPTGNGPPTGGGGGGGSNNNGSNGTGTQQAGLTGGGGGGSGSSGSQNSVSAR